jgi:hypothetical protein
MYPSTEPELAFHTRVFAALAAGYANSVIVMSMIHVAGPILASRISAPYNILLGQLQDRNVKKLKMAQDIRPGGDFQARVSKYSDYFCIHDVTYC